MKIGYDSSMKEKEKTADLASKEDKFKLPPFPIKAMDELIGEPDPDEMPPVND